MSEKRKSDHIELSFDSRPKSKIDLGNSFYEPMLSPHLSELPMKNFLGFDFGMPLWVSSMTGGTEKAKKINENLARACGEFDLGMGLGSCRPLLNSNDRVEDFSVRRFMPDRPLYSNFGIAQCEELITAGNIEKIKEVNKRLEVDGTIIHVNPLQEWAQPEGDKFRKSPLETIKKVCDTLDSKVIVKEVGQGMGPKSLESLLSLPIAAIELAAFGGTNFTILEQTRLNGLDIDKRSISENFGLIGHSVDEMISFLNTLTQKEASGIEIIISGGVRDPLRGHVLMQSLELNSVVGMASELLKYATGDYGLLQDYLNEAKECFCVAKAFIK